jgi:hypothetical protein
MRTPSSIWAEAETGEVGHALAPRPPNGYRIRRLEARVRENFWPQPHIARFWEYGPLGWSCGQNTRLKRTGARLKGANAGAITAIGRANAVKHKTPRVLGAHPQDQRPLVLATCSGPGVDVGIPVNVATVDGCRLARLGRGDRRNQRVQPRYAHQDPSAGSRSPAKELPAVRPRPFILQRQNGSPSQE